MNLRHSSDLNLPKTKYDFSIFSDLTISGENSAANTASPINKRRGFSG